MSFGDGSRQDVPEPDVGTGRSAMSEKQEGPGTRKSYRIRESGFRFFLSPAAACRRCFPASFRAAVPTLVRVSVPGRSYRSGRSPVPPSGGPENDLFFRINFGIAARIRYLCNQLI